MNRSVVRGPEKFQLIETHAQNPENHGVDAPYVPPCQAADVEIQPGSVPQYAVGQLGGETTIEGTQGKERRKGGKPIQANPVRRDSLQELDGYRPYVCGQEGPFWTRFSRPLITEGALQRAGIALQSRARSGGARFVSPEAK